MASSRRFRRTAFAITGRGKVVEMLEPEIAEPIEKELAAKGRGLLSGGAAYCDIYSGGAEETEFCPGQSRWKRLDEAAVWKKAVLILLHLPALVRMFATIGRETVLSTWRLIRTAKPGPQLAGRDQVHSPASCRQRGPSRDHRLRDRIRCRAGR